MMIPVEKKSMIEIDRKNMLNRYSKIAWKSSSDRPMNSKAPQEQAKQADPEDRAAKQDHRQPEPRAGQERANRVARQTPAEVSERAGRLIGLDWREFQSFDFRKREAHDCVPASSDPITPSALGRWSPVSLRNSSSSGPWCCT